MKRGLFWELESFITPMLMNNRSPEVFQELTFLSMLTLSRYVLTTLFMNMVARL